MRISSLPHRLRLIALGAWAAAALCAEAQEGFPLDGTWRGEVGSGEDAAPVVLVMKWDGEQIDGRINPGPDELPFESAKLFPADWSVRIESRTAGGEPIVIRGRLMDIGSYNRHIVGTWTQAGKEHDFEMTRL